MIVESDEDVWNIYFEINTLNKWGQRPNDWTF